MATKTTFLLQCGSFSGGLKHLYLELLSLLNGNSTERMNRIFGRSTCILITSLHFLEELGTGLYLFILLTANYPESVSTMSLLIADYLETSGLVSPQNGSVPCFTWSIEPSEGCHLGELGVRGRCVITQALLMNLLCCWK